MDTRSILLFSFYMISATENWHLDGEWNVHSRGPSRER